jgi:hypothetical protein
MEGAAGQTTAAGDGYRREATIIGDGEFIVEET